MSDLCLGTNELDVVFPFHIVIDRAMRIVRTGTALRRLLPGIAENEFLDRVFSIELPAVTVEFDDVRAHDRHLFKLHSRDLDKLTLKGQMLYLTQGDVIVFLGSPWTASSADMIALGLSLKDFAIHDSVPDFLLQMYSLKHSLGDAHKLTERLATVNRSLEHRVAERTAEVVAANEALQETNRRLEREIAERKIAEEHVRQLAHFDPLTGLANRTLLRDRLNHALAARRRDQRRLALMFIDLDRFKPINDTHGHHVGDALLKAVATRLLGFVREGDTVARLGGDEFVVVLTEVNGSEDAEKVVEKIACGLAKPYLIDTCRLETTPSIGISLYPENGDDGDTLIRNADSAMYAAKSCGRNQFRFFARA